MYLVIHINMDDLKIPMNRYCVIGDQLKNLMTQIKELRVEYKDLETMILDRMNTNDIDDYNFNSTCIFKRKKKLSKCSLNKDTVSSGISHMFKDPTYISCKNDEDRANFGADIIMNSREQKEVYVLERKNLKQ